MVEIFGMKVDLELQAKNIEKVKQDIKSKLRRVDVEPSARAGAGARPSSWARVSGPVTGAVGQASPMAAGMMGRMGGMAGASRAAGGTSAAGAGAAGGGAAGGGAAGGAAAGSAALGAVAAVAVAVGAAIVVLKIISGKITKMIGKLGEASASFQSSKDLIDKMWNLALRPIGNIMTMLMRPYLLLAMQFLRPRLKAMGEILKESKGGYTEEAMDKIKDIWSGTAEGLMSIFQDMWRVVKPIAAEVDGFTSAIKIVFNSWLSGIASWFKGLALGFKSVLTPMPDTLGMWILESIKKDPSFLESLPENTAAKFFKWIIKNPTKFEELPNDARDKMFSWIENNPAQLPYLTGDVADKFYGWLTEGPGADRLKDVNSKYATELTGWLNAEDNKEKVKDAIEWGTNWLKGIGIWLRQKIQGILDTDIGNWLWGIGMFLYKTITDSIVSAFSNFTFGWKWWWQKKQTGAEFIDQEGLYYLHRGEKVVSQPRANDNSRSMVFKPTFVVSGNITSELDMDSLARRAGRITELEMRKRGLI